MTCGTFFASGSTAIVAYGWRAHGSRAEPRARRSLDIEDLNACAARRGLASRGRRDAAHADARQTSRARSTRFRSSTARSSRPTTSSLATIRSTGCRSERDDLRRACEVQVKSHLLHLREELPRKRRADIADIETLVRESAPGFAALLRHLARLEEAADGRPSGSRRLRDAADRAR